MTRALVSSQLNVDGLQVLLSPNPPQLSTRPPASLPECLHGWRGPCIYPHHSLGMARDRAARDSRHYYDEHSSDERERRHRRRHRLRDYDDEHSAARRERRERRRADEARRDAELDIHDLRARRESYYSRPEPDRRRESQRMAQEIRIDREKEKPRSSHREVRRDGTVRRKKRRERVEDDRSDDYVYGRPKSQGVEDVTVRRSSTRRRSEGGGSSSRTAYTPLSGSRSASLRKDDAVKLNRSMSAREPQRVYMTRPSLRRTSTIKLPTATVAPVARPPPVSPRDPARRSTGSIFANLFKPPARPPTQLLHKDIPRLVLRILVAV